MVGNGVWRKRIGAEKPLCGRKKLAPPAQVVRTTVFLADLGDFQTVNGIYAEVFGKSALLAPAFRWQPPQGSTGGNRLRRLARQLSLTPGGIGWNWPQWSYASGETPSVN